MFSSDEIRQHSKAHRSFFLSAGLLHSALTHLAKSTPWSKFHRYNDNPLGRPRERRDACAPATYATVATPVQPELHSRAHPSVRSTCPNFRKPRPEIQRESLAPADFSPEILPPEIKDELETISSYKKEEKSGQVFLPIITILLRIEGLLIGDSEFDILIKC